MSMTIRNVKMNTVLDNPFYNSVKCKSDFNMQFKGNNYLLIKYLYVLEKHKTINFLKILKNTIN